MLKSLGKVSGCIIDSVAADHAINISKYKSLNCSNYIKLPKGYTVQKKVSLIFRW